MLRGKQANTTTLRTLYRDWTGFDWLGSDYDLRGLTRESVTVIQCLNLMMEYGVQTIPCSDAETLLDCVQEGCTG